MKKRLAGLVVVGLAATMALAACGGGPGERFDDCDDNPATCNSGEAEDGGSITWVVSVVPDSWFTLDAVGGSIYSQQTISGIFAYTGGDDPAGDYQYNFDLLAEEPVLLEEDPWTFQFVLRDEAVWSDGTPITADDFRALWYLASSEAKGFCNGCAPRGGGAVYDDIASIEGSDDGKTVTITMEDGEADPEYWGWGNVHGIAGGLIPWHVAEQEGYDWDNPDDVGEYFTWLHEVPPAWSGGPFQIVAEESQLGDQVIWERNPNWYGDPVPLETVVIRYLTDDNGWSDALANGEMDGAAPPDLNPDIVEQLQDQNDVSMNITDGPAWEHLDVNLRHSQLGELELRRAIFTAVDVEDIADANFGEVYPDVRPRRNYSFHQDHPYFEDVMEGTGFGSGDIEAARQILADAGYEGYEDGQTLTLDGERIGPFRLNSTDTAPRNNAKLLVQDYLSQIGIEITIESTDELGKTLGSGDYDLMIFGWSGPSSLFATDAFQWGHSTSSSNFGGFDNPDYDAAAQRAAVATSEEEAAAALNEAYRVSAPEAYVLPLYDTPVYIFAIGDYVNLRDNGNTSIRALYNVHEWGVAVE